MSDVKSKSKKMDIRLAEDLFEEIVLVAWGSEKKRSELIREMIASFVAHGELEIDDQKMTWPECVAYLKSKLVKEELSVEEIQQQTRANKPSAEMPEPLREELEVFANMYVQNAMQAFKKHVGE